MSILFWASTNPTTELGLQQKTLEWKNELKTWIKFPLVKSSFFCLFIFLPERPVLSRFPLLKKVIWTWKQLTSSNMRGQPSPERGICWWIVWGCEVGYKNYSLNHGERSILGSSLLVPMFGNSYFWKMLPAQICLLPLYPHWIVYYRRQLL